MPAEQALIVHWHYSTVAGFACRKGICPCHRHGPIPAAQQQILMDSVLFSSDRCTFPAGVADPERARDPAPSVALWAEADSFTLGVWPHRFEAMYTVSPPSVAMLLLAQATVLKSLSAPGC